MLKAFTQQPQESDADFVHRRKCNIIGTVGSLGVAGLVAVVGYNLREYSNWAELRATFSRASLQEQFDSVKASAKLGLHCQDAQGQPPSWHRPAAIADLSALYARGCQVRIQDAGYVIYTPAPPAVR